MSNLRYKVVTFLPDPPQPGSSGSGGGSSGGGSSGGGSSGDGGDGSTQLPRLALQLSGPWKWSVGLEPDTNSATISYLEFDKLNGVVGDVTGTVEFWYTQPAPRNANGNPTPDVALASWKIIDVEAGKIGTVFVAGVLTHRIVEYKLVFQDSRWAFVNPRGGRVRLGLINAGVKPPDDEPTDSDVPELGLDELIVACLTAMNLGTTSFPAEVVDTDAPRDLKWYGNHAPTELAKLLELCGCVFCPQIDGTFAIQTIVTSGDPNITAPDGVLPEVTLPIIDRRGKTVIVTSHPNANCLTQTLQGPQDDQWQFVCHDSNGDWQTYANCDLLTGSGSTMLQLWQGKFAGLIPTYATKAEQLNNEAYRYIRLGDGTGGSAPAGAQPQIGGPNVAPVLTQMIESDSSLNPIQVLARVVRQASDGTYSNVSNVAIAAQFKADENVIQLAGPLLQIASGGTDPIANAQELQPGDFTVRYSTVQLHQDNEGRWVPTFFAAGFQRQAADANGNTLYPMTDAEVQNALDGGVPDAVIIDRPDLRGLINSTTVGSFATGQPDNQQDLIDAAQTIADKALANSSDPTRIIRAKGFAAVVLDGLVSAVQWDQSELLTTAQANNWYRPAGALSLTQWRREERSDAEQFPKQAQTQENRVALGEPGATRAFMAVMPTNSQPMHDACVLGTPVQLAGQTVNTYFQNSNGGNGVSVDVLSDVWWDSDAGQLNKVYRTFQYNTCGSLYSIGDPISGVIDTATPCA